MPRLVDALRAYATVGLGVLLAALGAVCVALPIAPPLSVSSVFPATLSLLAVSAGAVALAIAELEKASARRFEDQARSYREMLDEHFLVTKVGGDGRFCEANGNYLRRTGYSLGELASKPMGGLSSGLYASNYLEEMWSIVQSGRTWSGEFCDRTKDGSLLWVRAIVVPWRNARGEIVSLTTIGIDVTEQRSAEADVKTANARLEAFIKHAPAAVAMFDREMRYVAHTDRWLQDYHLPQRSLVGRCHYDVFPEVPEHWKAKHLRILAGATESSEEERFQRADGSENIIRWEVRPWYLNDGSVGGIMMLTEEISERKRMQDKLWRLAKLDNLTGLPNRLLFNETLRDAIVAAGASKVPLGVALMDLDHFKEINDTLGHDAGDELLKVVGGRLQAAISDFGIVARLGGDEFAVLVTGGADGRADVPGAIAAIEMAMAEPVHLAGVDRNCHSSIGVTLFPDDATKPSDLLKNADLALYRAKSLGRGCSAYFSNELRASINRRVELQANALEAIAHGEFILYFQPIVHCGEGEPISFEALLRWCHPLHGILTPVHFEEVLEHTKVAAALSERVLDLAIGQAARWQAEGMAFGRVAINVTSADFSFGSFSLRLKRKLERYGLPAAKVCIEVTERVFLGKGSAHVGEALEELHEMGVEIALDDFGTGYASLSHIKAYPIDRLKIDRSFVKDMQASSDSLSIVQAIVQLARSLGLAITAEGVESVDQLRLLQSMGCGCIQGFYYSRPLPPADVPQFLGKLGEMDKRIVA